MAIEAGLRDVFAYEFMVNAFRAGTIVAVVSATMGWFMVLRRQTFAGHTLSVVGFPGAAGAILIGFSSSAGYFAFCVAAALVIGAAQGSDATGSYREESALIGTVQATALAAGFLFVGLYHGNLNGLTALLFGSFLGISSAQVLQLLVVGSAGLVILAIIARPLLFASVDPQVAAAAGVPARGLAIAFLVVLGIAAAETSQITGSLLVFALLVLPAASAHVITGRPVLGVGISVAVALAVTWASLFMAYFTPYPIGAFVTTLSFAVYVAARGVRFAATRTRTGLVPAFEASAS
jgi:zinc/manganese transport system permease protein